MTARSQDDHLMSRPAFPAACPHCAAAVLVAIDGGLTVTATAMPLAFHAEIAARIMSRAVYDLVRIEGSRKAYLHYRDIFRVRGPREYPVVADHYCPDGSRPVISWQPPEKKPASKKTPVITDGKVPF